MVADYPIKALVAVSSENIVPTSTLFEEGFDVMIGTSLTQVHGLLTKEFDLIAAFTCFDESRMFDLLRYCKADPELKDIPFIAMRIRGLRLDDTTHQAIQIATKALGAEEYIDWQRKSDTALQQSSEFKKIISMLLERKRLAS